MKEVQWNVCFSHCYGLMRCQCETVSTPARIFLSWLRSSIRIAYDGSILVVPLSVFPRGLVGAFLKSQFSHLFNGLFNPSNCHLRCSMWLIRETSLQDRPTTCLFEHVYANLSLFLLLVALPRSRTYAIFLGPFKARRPSL